MPAQSAAPQRGVAATGERAVSHVFALRLQQRLHTPVGSDHARQRFHDADPDPERTDNRESFRFDVRPRPLVPVTKWTTSTLTAPKRRGSFPRS